MALKLYERYPQLWESPSNDYPQGAFKNLSAQGETDGSYLEKDWLNDYSGFFGALLRNAEMTPDGTIDTAQRSQFYDALVKVAKESVDLSAYRKKDDLLFKGTLKVQATDDVAAGVFLQDMGGTVRGQVVATDQGLQLTQYPKDGGLQTFTFPVGGGGELMVKDFPVTPLKIPSDFNTIQEAINGISENVMLSHSSLSIVLESGYLISEPTVISGGDWTGVTLESEDEVVLLSPDFPLDKWVIEVKEGSKSLNISLLIDANKRALGGYSITDNSSCTISEGSGVFNSWGSGLSAFGNSTVYASKTVFRDNVQNPAGTGSGIVSWSSQVYAEGADVSNSGFYGAQAAAGGFLNFRNGNADNCQAYGVRATNAGVVNCPYVTAKNCGKTGIRAFDGGVVEARFSDSSGCSESNISVSGGGRIIASNSTSDNAKGVAVIAIGGDAVLTETTFNDCEGEIFNINGANIYANSIVASTSITNKNAINIRNSMVSMFSATISGGFKGVNIHGSSSVDMKNATVSNALSVGVDIYESSNVNGEDSKVIDYGIRGFQVRDASSVNLKGAIANKINSNQGENTDVLVSFGGIVSLHNSNNGSNISPNTLSSNGIIFK